MIIWGTRTKGEPRGFAIGQCRRCKEERVLFIAELKTKFTLYFVPTFTTSRKALVVCTTCEYRDEFEGEIGRGLIEAAVSQEVMLARLDDDRPGAGRTDGRAGGSLTGIDALAVGLLVAGLQVAMLDKTFEASEADALSGSIAAIAVNSHSAIVVATATTIAANLPDLVDWISSPATPSFAAILASAGVEARTLAVADQKRYFGQLGWLCHQVAAAGTPGVEDTRSTLIEGIFTTLGLAPGEVVEVFDFCQANGG